MTKKMKKDKKEKNLKYVPDSLLPENYQPVEKYPTPTDNDTEMMAELVKELNKKISGVIKDDKDTKFKKNVDIEQLQNILKEYMNTYLVLGYTLEGQPFIISYAKTPQDHNSLVEHLRLTFLNTFKSPLF